MDDDIEILTEKVRVCEFHQLYKDKDMEKHKYTGRAYRCLKCRKIGCLCCLNRKDWELYVSNNIFVCSPCYYHEQLRISIRKK